MSGLAAGKDTRATVVRASCPEPSIAKLWAKRTALGGPALRKRSEVYGVTTKRQNSSAAPVGRVKESELSVLVRFESLPLTSVQFWRSVEVCTTNCVP